MKKYWKSIEEKDCFDVSVDENQKKLSHKSTLEDIATDIPYKAPASRRDFLKLCGFSITAATLAASCETPVRKTIPYLNKPEEIVPGIANYYASSLFDGGDYCSVLVKTREGRPIKIEGNELSSMTKGGTSARIQASVLSLYDDARLKNPLKKGDKTSWNNVDENVKSLLGEVKDGGKKIAILSSTVISPSTKSVYNDFVKAYPNTQVVYYDAISASALLQANKMSFNEQIIPDYRFDKAAVIVSFGADFLGTWLSPIEYTKGYAKNRKLDINKTMSRHIQFESGLSLSGSNADERIPIKPSEEGVILANLYNELASLLGKSTLLNVPKTSRKLKSLAKELVAKQGKSLVISNSNNVHIQLLVNAINDLLGNYNNTIDLNNPLQLKQGLDTDMDALVSDMNSGKVEALILNNVNPAYDYCQADKFKEGLKKLKLSLSFSATLDETASLVDFVCPDDHYLESWGDAEPKKGIYSLAQPTINKLFDTRSAQESLLKWTGNNISYLNYVKEYWKKHIYPLQSKASLKNSNFKKFWVKSLQDGVFEVPNLNANKTYKFKANNFKNAVAKVVKSNKQIADSFELYFSESVALGNGKHANNPWLQELPDPITKVCWDNYASMSITDAKKRGLENGDVVVLSTKSNNKIEIPVLLQPGQTQGTLSIALGFGRKSAGKVGNNVGQNVFALAELKEGNTSNFITEVKLKKTSENHALALTQTHYSMEGRDIIRETTLAKYLKNPASGNEKHEKYKEGIKSLYEARPHIGNHWGLSIDLNACTACGNCIIACQAENNVPVVGKEEVRRRRSMHWMRVDRYYSDSVDTPQVLHLPVMCQHCDSAPCENVCPVAATTHSKDGLNNIAYNRCIGTRYCMNNCPYKVRRFNWYAYTESSKFDYNMNSDLGRMVLNPDVVVRVRGVVEKCSMCVQRIQEGTGKAKQENRELIDGEIKTSCVQSCPADALVFGNMNDKNSKISKKLEDERTYHLLEDLSVLPSVAYQTKVRNQPNKLAQ